MDALDADAGLDPVALVRDGWGLDARSAERLTGERDDTWKVLTAEGPRILKVSPAGAETAEVELEVAALQWLEREPDLPVPRICPAASGPLVRVAGPPVRCARLQTFLPGRLLAHVRPRSDGLAAELGALLARVDRAFEGFAPPEAARPGFLWDLERASDVIAARLATLPTARAHLVRDALERLREVEPALGALPRGVIHGDANDHNVLVGPPRQEPPGPPGRVTGLIDFGDVLENPRVAELAIGAAYALLGTPDPVGTATHVTCGYHAEAPLSEPELDVLWPLILGRLAVSISISCERVARGDDDPYVTISQEPAWDALERLTDVHPRIARGALRQACGLEACPGSHHVVRALRDVEPAPVLPSELLARPHVLELGLDGADRGPDLLDAPGAFRRHVERVLEDRGATVGIGRYDEVRCDPVADPEEASDPGAARRVHLGLDLFVPAGTPVHTPLAGRVHRLPPEDAESGAIPSVVLAHELGGAEFWTLYGHLSPASLDHLREGTEVAAGQRLGAVADPADAGAADAAPHVHLQVLTDLLDDAGVPAAAAVGRRGVWLGFSPDPSALVGAPLTGRAPRAPSTDELLATRSRLLPSNLSVSYREPLHVVRGWKQYLFDAEGRRYLDAVNNVAHVGHAHPRVAAAAAGKRVLETNTRYLHRAILTYVERLLATFPDPLSVCFLVNSGSEANELALRIARTVTGREPVVVLDGAYHGHTSALVDLSPYKNRGPGGSGPPAWVRVVPLPDLYRGRYRDEDGAAAAYASHVTEACDPDGTAPPAAFLHESLPSCAGQIVLPDGYLNAAYGAVRAAGGLVIADEIQVGLGRVGDHVWGFQTQAVAPDVVTLGKPLGNGHPLGAVVTTRAVADAFDRGMEFFSSFGGNPVSCAIGSAVLEVLDEEDLRGRARDVGARLKRGLEGLREAHAAVGDVRGLGLFLGVELVSDREARTPDAATASYLVERARERGVLLSADGVDRNVLKIKPPLCFGAADADRLVALLDQLLREDFVTVRGSAHSRGGGPPNES